MSPPSLDLVAAFRDLGFDELQAMLLAMAQANPAVVKYRLDLCGMTHHQAVRIYA